MNILNISTEGAEALRHCRHVEYLISSNTHQTWNKEELLCSDEHMPQTDAAHTNEAFLDHCPLEPINSAQTCAIECLY